MTIRSISARTDLTAESVGRNFQRQFGQPHPGYDTVLPHAQAIALLTRLSEPTTRRTPEAANAAAALLAEFRSGAHQNGHLDGHSAIEVVKSVRPRLVVAKKRESVNHVFTAPQLMPEQSQEAEPINWNAVLNGVRSAILIGIVLGHAGLVWYDCAALWDTPGGIGGALVFFIVLAAVMFAADPSKNRTSSFALWFVALVDAAAYFVHKPVFDEYGAGHVITAAICAFVCACSWVALYLYQDQNLD